MGILIIIGRVLITVLKVILLLFLLALLLVGLVLFVPVRYKVVVCKEPVTDGGNLIDNFLVKGIISWCLFVVRIPFSFENSRGNYRIRFLGIDINKLRDKFRERKKQKILKRIEKSRNKKKTDTEVQEVKGKAETDTKLQETKGRADKDNRHRAERKSIWQRIRGFFAGIFTWFADMRNKIKDIIEKIKKIPSLAREKKTKAEDIIGLLKSDMVKESICVVRKNVVHLWGKLKPRSVKGRVRFGTSDPCLTGQILGGIAIFMGMTGLYFDITPNFEESVLEGRIEIKGRLQFATLLKIIVRLYLDENIKKVAGKFGLF